MNDFETQKKRIKSLVEGSEPDAALAECNALLAKHPEWRADLLRSRAYVFAHRGMYEAAIADREALIGSGEGILRDYYQLGDNALSAGRFADASKWFQEVLRLGTEQNESWFDAAALLLLSYSQMQLGHLYEAAQYVEKAIALESDCAMPVRGEGLVAGQALREEITRRIASTPKRRV
jgi:tetratricopeptide (TPR) repeat protein